MKYRLAAGFSAVGRPERKNNLGGGMHQLELGSL